MAFINYVSSTCAIKVVYYGPGLSGKTTNIKYISQKLDSASRSELVCLENEASSTQVARTYFFDLLFVNAGLIGDFTVHFQLMTCPGQAFMEASRKSVLSGADGLVFVADSHAQLLDANLQSFESLRRLLGELNMDIDSIPMVFQYNKRDLEDLIPVETLNTLLNPLGRPFFEAVAIRGQGIFETLRGIASLTIPIVRQQILPEAVEADVEEEEEEETTEEKVEKAIEAVKSEPAGSFQPEVGFSSARRDTRPLAEADAEPEPLLRTSAKEDISREIRKIRLKSDKDVEKELKKLMQEFGSKG